MWRYVKIVERYCIGRRIHPSKKNVTDIDCGKDFIKLQTFWRRRNYTPEESLVAYSMAIDRGYLLNNGELLGSAEQVLSITGEGLQFATPSGLLNELAGAVAKVSALSAVVISALSLVVSIIALKHVR